AMFTAAVASAQVVNSKTAKDNGDGTYTLTLESFVTGSLGQTISTSRKPINAVLVLDVSGSMNDALPNKQGASVKKIKALKDASKAFVEAIAKDAEENNINHKISLVKFCGLGDDLSDIYYNNGHIYINRTETVVTLDKGSVLTNKNGLISKIEGLYPAGATRAHDGMRLAAKEISQADTNATKLVVMFTDGNPTESSGFQEKVAGQAINYSKQIKDNNAKVYSIGIFNDQDYTPKVEQYMNYLSSNYPSAEYIGDDSNWLFKGVESAKDTTYHSRVDNSEALTGVFESIASESVKGGADVEMETSQTVVKDILSSSFVLPEGTSASKIRVSIADFDEENTLENASKADYKFKTPVAATDLTVEIGEEVIDGETLQTISVKNFDFSKNWCGPITVNKNGVVTKSWNPGKKLIFSFEIIPNPSAVGGLVTTNHKNSGVYYKDKLTNEFGSVAFEVPAPQYTPMDLIIRKKGLNPGESAIFEVTRSVNGSLDPDFKITVVMTAGSEGATDDAVIVKTPVRDENKVDYVYIVKETSWSWAYKQTEALSHSLYKADGSADNVFEFTNVTKTDLPKHSEKAKNNVFE
ncbi:MAG: VWA domain-containing protein, partial [Rikenellaceae bacterium]|nr:VWA domain-containing protein [Rikenellaceae bacterium]